MIARYPGRPGPRARRRRRRARRPSGRIASLLGARAGTHRLLARRAPLAVRARRPLPDADPQRQHRLGRLGHRRAGCGGLTDFGREVVRGDEPARHARRPVTRGGRRRCARRWTSPRPRSSSRHSCARALSDHPRNVPDDVLARLAGNGGVCMVTFVPAFLSQECARLDGGRGRGRRPRPRRCATIAAVESTAAPSGRRAHPQPRATPSPRWPTTSSTSARSPASTTSASAATSTAPTRCRRAWRTSPLPGAVRRAAPPRLVRRRPAPGWPGATSCGCCGPPRRSRRADPGRPPGSPAE